MLPSTASRLTAESQRGVVRLTCGELDLDGHLDYASSEGNLGWEMGKGVKWMIMSQLKYLCRRPSAVVNLNCVTNRVAPGSRYKLSYDAEQYNTIHTLLNNPYLQPPHPTVRQ